MKSGAFRDSAHNILQALAGIYVKSLLILHINVHFLYIFYDVISKYIEHLYTTIV
jgi:hypothetical protein